MVTDILLASLQVADTDTSQGVDDIVRVIYKIDLPESNPDMVIEGLENAMELKCSGTIDASSRASNVHKLHSDVTDCNEEFRIVEGFDNYEASNFGRIRNKKTDKFLKPSIDSNGYFYVVLSQNKNKKTHRVHKLVAKSFIPNPDNKPSVNHIDTNKLNNSVNNLRWATKQEYVRNKNLTSSNTSGIKGVTFHKQTNKWRAQIVVDGIYYYLGLFDNIEDAKAARQKEAKSAFGEFLHPCEEK